MIRFMNTMTGAKEEFKPLRDKKVGMYNCGPTVYYFAHIGNLRSYVFADVLRRTLECSGYDVTQVVNITDIGHLVGDGDEGEDKMTKGLKREGKPLTLAGMKELADFYTDRFVEDLKALNIKTPTHLPKASEHIEEEIDLVRKLEEKGFTYQTSDGIYFDTSKDADYGKLGNIKLGASEETSRIGVNSEKRNPRDFALWKFNDALGFESPWGKGFPGWHIECSAMSMKYLGESYDIHTGGVDHIPVHHNNEIAQAESATGKQYVRVWMHNAFVNIEGGKKMAKSEGNFLSLKVLEEKGISPLAYRYWLLGARYSAPMAFSFEAVEGAQNAYKRLVQKMSDLGDKSGTVAQDYLARFDEAMDDDLDTPQALAILWEMLGDASLSDADKKATALDFDRTLGLGLDRKPVEEEVPMNIKALLADRDDARAAKDWKRSDALRAEIEKSGYIVKDTPEGQKISKK